MLVPAVDRLELFHPTKSSPTLGITDKKAKSQRSFGYRMRLRTAGGAGRLLLKRSLRLGHGLGKKVLYLVEMFECGEGGPLRINVYNPRTSERVQVNLSSRERVDLINGSISDYARWAPKLLTRLQIKGIAVKKGRGRAPKQGEGARVLLDRTLHTHSLKVVTTDPADPADPANNIAADPESVTQLLTVRCKVTGAEGGLTMEVYHYVASKQWTLELTDVQVQSHIRVAATEGGCEAAEEWEWPTADPLMRSDVIEHLASTLQWRRRDGDRMAAGLTARGSDGQAPPIVVGRRTDRVAMRMAEKQRLEDIQRAQAAMVASANGGGGGSGGSGGVGGGVVGDGQGNLVPAGSLKRKPLPLEKTLEDTDREELVLNSAFKVHAKQHAGNSTPSKVDQSAASGTTHVMIKVWHHRFKAFHFRFGVYNPETGATVSVREPVASREPCT
jgi:hypothetical protein